MRPIGVTDGLLVDIPVLGIIRYDLGRDGVGYHMRSGESFVEAVKQSL